MDGGHRGGGSLELARLVGEAGEHLVPDLKHYYGIDLRDLFSEDNPLSPAWALMHARNLPIESAFQAALRGGQQYRGWGPDRYMTARLIDLMGLLKYITVLAHRDPEGPSPAEPEPYPLPDALPRRERKSADKPGSFRSMATNLLAKAKARKAAEANDRSR